VTPNLNPFQRHRSVEALVSPQSRTAETYRRLRAMVDLAAGEQGGVRLVTSPSAGDGTTTVVANIGVSLATAARPVLLIDGNLYRPRLHTVFGLPNDIGLTSVISGDATLDAAIHVLPEHPGVHVLTAGPPVADPASLLAGPAAEQIMAAAASSAPVVFVDGPPLLPVTGGVVLADLAAGVLVVTRAGRTSRSELASALELVARTGTPVLGVVLNAVRGKRVDRARYRDRRYSIQHGTTETSGGSGSTAYGSSVSDEVPERAVADDRQLSGENEVVPTSTAAPVRVAP